MYKNSEEQSLNNKINLKRNSSLLSTSSSHRFKKIKLRNELSPFHRIGKTSNTKKIINLPVCISLFTNNHSINENDTKLKLNQKSKLNMKFMNLNNPSMKEYKENKENKKNISRNPNSFLINSFSPKNLNSQGINISNYYKFSSSGLKNLSKPKLVKLNYSPSYKFTQQNIPTKNKNNNMSNTTIEQDISAIKSTNNTLNNIKINKIKYLLSSPHTSEGLEKGKKGEKIPNILPQKDKIKNYEGISNLKYSKNNKIYDEINKIINESNLKRKYKLNIGTNSNKSNNALNKNLSPINNKEKIEINSQNLEKNSIENIETNIENNLENNSENNNKIIEDIKNITLEKAKDNENDTIKNLKEKIEKKRDIFKTKTFQELKKNVSEFQKKEKEKKKIVIDNKDNKDTKVQPSTNNTTIDKNILKKIKNNKFYLTICKGKTNNIYKNNDFLNDLNNSIKNVNNMNLFAKKTEMLINCKNETEQIINHEKSQLKEIEITCKIYSYFVKYLKEEHMKKEDKLKKEINEYINFIKKSKIKNKFICNLDSASRSYIQNEYEFEGLPYILTGKKSTKHLDLVMSNSFAKFRKHSSKDNFIIKKTNLKDKNKDEDIMNKSAINMLAIQGIILKSLYYYKDSKNIKNEKNVNKDKNKNEKKVIHGRIDNKKTMSFHTNSSKILLKDVHKKNSVKLSNLHLNNLLNNRKMIKRSSTLVRDNILKIKNSPNSDININHYSILQQKHFFKKRKLSSDDKNSNKNDNIYLINEKDNSGEDSQDTDKIYIELMKLIFEGKNNSFINFYKKNKEYIDVNQDLFDGNTLLILSAKDGNFFISKFLCEQGAKINIQNNLGNTALHYAIGKQFYGVADVLTRHGAKEDIRNNMGLSPWECIDHNMED